MFDIISVLIIVMLFQPAKIQKSKIITISMKKNSQTNADLIFCANLRDLREKVYVQIRAIRGDYSYLSAEIGSMFAAFFAGYQPKKMPVRAQTRNDPTIAIWLTT